MSQYSAEPCLADMSVFDDPDVAAELAEIHDKFIVVPADKASKNIVCLLLNAWYEYHDRKPYI